MPALTPVDCAHCGMRLGPRIVPERVWVPLEGTWRLLCRTCARWVRLTDPVPLKAKE